MSIYTVRRGDTLDSIARRFQTTAAALARRNGIRNPNRLSIGQQLHIDTFTPGPSTRSTTAASDTTRAARAGDWPMPVDGRVSSPYGWRRHPISGRRTFHTGLDIAAPTGTPVRVPAGGRVAFAGWNGGYGNYVVVDHGNGLRTAYAHLSRIHVRVGQTVDAGTSIGAVGSTGRSTGPHLHFEVKRNGSFVDPRAYLRAV